MFWKKKDKGASERRLHAGENAYQQAGFRTIETADPLALARFHAVTESRAPTYVELASVTTGLDALARVVESLRPNQKGDPQVCTILNSGNPIGIGLDAHAGLKAVQRARVANPKLCQKSIVLTNFSIGPDVAGALEEMAPTLVAAPSWDDGAPARMGKTDLLYSNPALRWPNVERIVTSRRVRGGVLEQEPATFTLPDLLEFEWTREETDGVTEDDLCLAFAAAWSSHHGGHEVAFASQSALLGCAGGPTIEEAVHTAVDRARQRHDLQGSVFVVSTPLRAGPAVDLLVNCGCRAGLLHEGTDDHEAIVSAFRARETNIGLMPLEDTGWCRV